MSEILAVVKRKAMYWLMLDCGHWVKWTGSRLSVGRSMTCPACHMPQVKMPEEAPRSD